MRTLGVLLALALAGAACADTTGPTTTVPAAPTNPPATTAVSVTTVAPPTTAVTPPTTTTTTSTTTSTTTAPPPAEPFSADRQFVLAAGAADWEDTFVDPGGIVFHDGVYHMFYNGIETWPAQVRVGYATSEDGLKWQKQADEGVFSGEDLPYVGVSLFVSTALVEDDGTWVLYFYSVEEQGTFDGTTIGRATAPSPLGPWTADPSPVLTTGPEGSWDAETVSNPNVVRVGEQYWMYYDGHNGDLESLPDRSIGLAVGDDGVSFAKYNDPETIEPPYDMSDPLLGPGPEGSWDEQRLMDPEVIFDGAKFVMTYRTRHPGTGTTPFPEYDLGLAFSVDGVEWAKDDRNPFLTSKSLGLNGIFLTTLVSVGDDLHLYFDGGSGSGTSVWVAVQEGPLAP